MNKPADVESLELKISYFLRYGVLASAILLTFGWLGEFIRNPEAIQHFQVYNPVSLHSLFRDATAAHDYFRLSSLLGLGLLVSLPIIRVFLTAVLFLKNRDWYLAAMALFVSSILVLSFFLGIVL